MATKEERDARLDQLGSSVSAWAAQRRKQLQDEAAALKKLLKGRTGSERLNNTTVTTASSLLVDEIDQFLTGE